MKTISLISLVFFFVVIPFSNSEKKETIVKIKTTVLNEVDGPYIYDKTDSLIVITVEKEIDSSFYIKKEFLNKSKNHQFTCKVSNTDQDIFTFSLMDEYLPPKAIYNTPKKLFATSDIEGNFNTFYSMLVGNNIMDKNFNWVYGKGHLVICGDMVDRGNNAWACLWLLYKLEQEAEKVGGKVHYILGNHDVMNMHANIRYVKKRYLELAKIISGKDDPVKAYKYLLSNSNEIAKWIASKNSIEKIGNSIYLHGGISEEIIDAGLSIKDINEIIRKNIRTNLTKYPGNDKNANLVFSRKGPLWYRGLVKDYKNYYKKINKRSLKKILKYYNVDHIVIGHTIVKKEVSTDFGGKVIRVDIKHPKDKFSGKSQGLYIENGTFYKVNDSGIKFKL